MQRCAFPLCCRYFRNTHIIMGTFSKCPFNVFEYTMPLLAYFVWHLNIILLCKIGQVKLPRNVIKYLLKVNK